MNSGAKSEIFEASGICLALSLTPALSRWEREPFQPIAAQTECIDFSSADIDSPSPSGRGLG
jgi:hypothetical protein